LQPMKQVASMLKRRFDNIITYLRRTGAAAFTLRLAQVLGLRAEDYSWCLSHHE
jgi:hypothetical protein